MLAGSRLASIAPWVLHHHERFDGTGYPAGLAGEQIPLESRILAVADAFDRLTSGGPDRFPVLGRRCHVRPRAPLGERVRPRSPSPPCVPWWVAAAPTSHDWAEGGPRCPRSPPSPPRRPPTVPSARVTARIVAEAAERLAAPSTVVTSVLQLLDSGTAPVRLIAARVVAEPRDRRPGAAPGQLGPLQRPGRHHRARRRAHRRAHPARRCCWRRAPTACWRARWPATASRGSTWCATAARSRRWPSRSRARGPRPSSRRPTWPASCTTSASRSSRRWPQERGVEIGGRDHLDRPGARPLRHRPRQGGRLDRPPLGPSRGPLPGHGAPPRPGPARRGRGPSGLARRHRGARRRRRRRRPSRACPRPRPPAAWPPTPSRRC